MWDLPPADPGIEIVIATRGMSKGLAQTDGPQAVIKPFVRFDWLQLGGQWKNVDSSNAEGEALVFASVSKKVGTLQLSGGVAYKVLTAVSGKVDSDSIELAAGASRKFGPVSGRISLVYSPDDLGSAKRSLYLEGGPSLQLPKGWVLSAAIGRRHRQGGADYTAFNAGISKMVEVLQLDLRYHDTAQSHLGEVYRGRIVGSVRLTF
jgi:uncharacterized protein (TIGR02001 family)